MTVTALDLEEKEANPGAVFRCEPDPDHGESRQSISKTRNSESRLKPVSIGTSATRVGIIKLQDIGYIKINPKTRIITPEPKGEAIVELVRQSAPELLNPILTASWEKGLCMVQNKEITADVFEAKLEGYVRRTIEKVKRAPAKFNNVYLNQG